MNKITLLYIAFILSVGFVAAQDGTLDTSFGNDGYAVKDFFGGSDRGTVIGVQDDGKIVVFGFVDVGSGFSYGLLRYMPDGELDTSFGSDGLVTTSAGNNYLQLFNSINIQADQKIVVSTTFIDSNENIVDFMLIRYLPNGDVDPSFGVDGIVMTDIGTDYLSATNLLPDGKILAGGSTTVGDDNSLLLAKYLPDGSLDASFGTNGTIVHYINNEDFKVFGIKVQNDGKILVPYRTEENFVRKFQVARFLPSGVLDTAFGNGGILQLDATSTVFHSTITIQNDGKILALVIKQPGTSIKRFFPNGDLDLSFGNNGTVEIDNDSFIGLKILIQPDNTIIVFGITFGFEPGNNLTYRFKPDGSLDNTFGTNGYASLGFEGADIVFQSDGKLLVAGNTFFYSGSGENFAVARLNNGLLGVSEYEKNHFKIYPNPSSEIFTVEYNFFSEKESYQIIDISGKIILEGKLENILTSIDLSSTQNGVYFLRTSNGVFRLLKK